MNFKQFFLESLTDNIWDHLEHKAKSGRLRSRDLGPLADALEDDNQELASAIRYMATNDILPVTLMRNEGAVFSWSSDVASDVHGITPSQPRDNHGHEPWTVKHQAIELMAQEDGATPEASPTGSRIWDVYFLTVKQAILALAKLISNNISVLPSPRSEDSRNYHKKGFLEEIAKFQIPSMNRLISDLESGRLNSYIGIVFNNFYVLLSKVDEIPDGHPVDRWTYPGFSSIAKKVTTQEPIKQQLLDIAKRLVVIRKNLSTNQQATEIIEDINGILSELVRLGITSRSNKPR